ncbi:Threonine synthase [Methanimicrococcus hongohii]|uniref:Cysteate synthase n=1 Tax=Methanimicrococcus hongohii TaxID=3028295 RepID=A0AA96UZD7_9EURY|nr:Threonine synthase [Methanimicrococcus sp. Hf6]
MTFQNKALSKHLGLPRLWLTFTGWAPERGCYAKTGSFKELEAYPTLSNISADCGKSMVIASAGNTGRAFAQAAAETGRSVVLIVPEKSVSSLWTVTESKENVKIITVSGDYFDAIQVSEKLCGNPNQSCAKKDEYIPEGGAKNIARRDGMGTVMLSAAETLGRLPDYYFQAVGSGTGGIAAWEASERLIQDGRFGSTLPKLHLIQNRPFTPMSSAWKRRSRQICEEDMPDALNAVASVYSPVLTNRSPPYGVAGGVFDALTACGGNIDSVDNCVADDAFKLFEEMTGIDTDPAAAVAFAGLIQAVEEKVVGANDTIVLNVTGGGYKRIEEDLGNIPMSSIASVSPEISADELKEILSN